MKTISNLINFKAEHPFYIKVNKKIKNKAFVDLLFADSCFYGIFDSTCVFCFQ